MTFLEALRTRRPMRRKPRRDGRGPADPCWHRMTDYDNWERGWPRKLWVTDSRFSRRDYLATDWEVFPVKQRKRNK